MNKNEFKVFAREAFWCNALDVAVDMIVAQWESDVHDARTTGQNEVAQALLPDTAINGETTV